MQESHTGFCDATVYESCIEYLTGAKFSWKGWCDLYQIIKYTHRELKLRHSRINHEKRKSQYSSFAKRRKKQDVKIKGLQAVAQIPSAFNGAIK